MAVARLAPLLARCDVLVEQFRPGVMTRLGLGYAAVKAVNPGVIYCAITGYGQHGPRRDEAGHDLNYIAATLAPGAVARACRIVRPCRRRSSPISAALDAGGDEHPARPARARRHRGGVLHRCRHGGCDVHLRLARAAPALQSAGFRSAGGAARPPAACHDTGSYSTRDGKLVACAALEQKFWLALLRRNRAWWGRLPTIAGMPPPPRPPSPPSWRAAPRRNGARCLPPPIAAQQSWRRWKRRSPIRILSAAVCSTTGSSRRNGTASAGAAGPDRSRPARRPAL